MSVYKPKNGNQIDGECLYIKDFTDDVTYYETHAESTHFIKIGKLICISYQGESKTHTNNTLIFKVPDKYKPSKKYIVPFIKNTITYGVVELATNGELKVNQIGAPTATGRLYFNFCYFTD